MLVPNWLAKSYAAETVTAISPGIAADYSGFCDGYISTAATTKVPVRASTYNEQSVNARRSVASGSASDAAGNTGARTISIKYYDQNMVGPFFETITLNGLTPVDTANTNICYIEHIHVETAGSGGVNAGILTIYVGTGGLGGTLATINVGDNQSFWAHHYIGAGHTAYIDDISINNDSKTVTSSVTLRARVTPDTDRAEIQISDIVIGGGAAAGQVTRIYPTPIRVIGPARIVMYVIPETNAALLTRAAFNFYDI